MRARPVTHFPCNHPRNQKFAAAVLAAVSCISFVCQEFPDCRAICGGWSRPEALDATGYANDPWLGLH